MTLKAYHFHFINGPQANQSSLQGFDMSLVYAAFEYQTAIYLSHDGVFHLLDKDATTGFIRDFQHQLLDWEMFELSGVYVDEKSLDNRGISKDTLPNAVTVLPHSEFCAQLLNATLVYNF